MILLAWHVSVRSSLYPTMPRLSTKKASTRCSRRYPCAFPPAATPFERLGIDLLGRFLKSATGNCWIIVAIDYLTCYAITRAVPTGTAYEVACFLIEEILFRHGSPRELLSDRGKAFLSGVVQNILQLLNTIHKCTSAYHPQTNGLTEQFNKILADMMSMYVDMEQKYWDKNLLAITFAYNTSRHDTIGYCPFLPVIWP